MRTVTRQTLLSDEKPLRSTRPRQTSRSALPHPGPPATRRGLSVGNPRAIDSLPCQAAVAFARFPRRPTRADQIATRPDRTRTLLDSPRMSRYWFLMGLTPASRCFTWEISLGSPCRIRRSLFRTIPSFGPCADSGTHPACPARDTAFARSGRRLTHSSRRTPP